MKMKGEFNMSENIFIASRQEIESEILQVNVNFKFHQYKEIPQKENVHFFYYNRGNKKLYYAIIASVEELHSQGELIEIASPKLCIVQFNNGVFQIKFNDSISEKPLNTLKDIYAKRNAKMVGDRSFSIYNTLELSRFSYALPIVDEITFMVEDEFRDMLLYDNSMIPDICEKRRTFAKIVREDEELSLTLLNENMLDIDYQYLLEEKYQQIYRPYFYEFTLSENAQKKLMSEGYSEELLYEIEIISVRNIKNEFKEQVLDGRLLFSASPLRRIPAYIKILHTNTDQTIDQQFDAIEQAIKTGISTVYNKNAIEQAFMNKIPLSKKADVNYEVKIYNVGQGNWIHILVYDADKLITKVVFDIGIGNGKGGHLDNDLRSIITKNAAKEIKDNYIFLLSHWDSDHIQGIVELQRNQFHTTWIMPNLPDRPGNGAKRLAAFLNVDPNITAIFIDHSLNNQLIFDNAYFKLGKGKGNGPGTHTSYTKENNSGLILAIKTSSKQMLFPGDCEYIQFPDTFKLYQSYDALILTHHGAKIKQTNLTLLGFNQSGGTNKFAVVCVGKDKSYPNVGHENSIKNLGYKIQETRNYKDANNPCQFKLI